MGIEPSDDPVRIFSFLVSCPGRHLLPEAVHDKNPARCATTVDRFGIDAADPPDPDVSEPVRRSCRTASPEWAGPPQTKGKECRRSTRNLRVAARHEGLATSQG